MSEDKWTLPAFILHDVILKTFDDCTPDQFDPLSHWKPKNPPISLTAENGAIILPNEVQGAIRDRHQLWALVPLKVYEEMCEAHVAQQTNALPGEVLAGEVLAEIVEEDEPTPAPMWMGNHALRVWGRWICPDCMRTVEIIESCQRWLPAHRPDIGQLLASGSPAKGDCGCEQTFQEWAVASDFKENGT